MNLFEAFKALDALNEDTFSVSDDGIAKLDEFQNDDELTDDIDVIDTEAETEDDLQDSYVGKVILDCGVCHSKIYKDKEEVELNEDQTLANVGEECPFCSTSDGFKIIGQVEDYSAENDEPETTDDEQPAEDDDDAVEESLSVSPIKDDIRDDKTESPTNTLAEGIFGPSKKKKAQMEREREEREYQEQQNQRKKDSQAWQDWCNQANANAAANKQRQDAERRARAEMRRADRERISKYSTGGGNTGHGGVHYSGGDYWESLEEAAAGTLERPMSAMGGTLSNIMTAHKDELSSIFDRESAMSFLDSIEPEVKNKGYLNTVRTKLERVPNNRISQFLYNIILKGDGMGTKMESIKEAYTDVDGVMGEKGAKYTEDDLKAYWDKENETDPVLADYKGNYQAWLKDTTSSMKVENLEEGIFNKKKKLTQQQPKTKREEKWEVFDQWHKWSVGEYDTKAEAEEAAASRGDDGRYRVQLVTKSLKESKSINEVAEVNKEDMIKAINLICNGRHSYREKLDSYLQYRRAEAIENLSDRHLRDFYNEVRDELKQEENPNFRLAQAFHLDESKSINEQNDESIVDFNTIKNNAIKCAKRDGYDQIIYKDKDGSYTIIRDYPRNGVDPSTIVGKAVINWSNGVKSVNYEDVVDESKSIKEAVGKTVEGTLYKVCIEGKDEFLLTEYFDEIVSYLDSEANIVKDFGAVIYTLSDFTFNTTPYLEYNGSIYQNLIFPDTDSKSVIYKDGVCKTALSAEEFKTPSKSNIKNYTIRLTNDIQSIKDGVIISPANEQFKSAVKTDKILHLFDTEQEALDYVEESPRWREMVSLNESKSIRENEDEEKLTAGKLTRLVKNITGLNTLKTQSTSVRGFHSIGEGSFKVTKEGYDDFRIIFYRDKDMQKKVKDELLSKGYTVTDMGNDIVVDAYKSQNESKSINESVNNVNVETDDSIVNVSSDENGKVTVTTEPITATDTASEGGDVLAPIDAETEDTIVNGSSGEVPPVEDSAIEEPVDGEEIDAEVDEFVEESFNHLCGNYLREVYDNVESFETSEVKENDKGLVVEGLIKFDSGNIKKTSFILEAKDCTRSGHCRFVGSNKHLSESADPYLITGKISRGKLICESLSYDYSIESENYKGLVKRG